MTTIELFVSLKVPDNIAITAFNTIKRMGQKQLNKLERSDYYKFDVEGDVEDFKEKISNVDILVNSNKNKFSFLIENDTNNKKNYSKNLKKINILIQDIDPADNLLKTLKERLGFTNIKKLEKGILWVMHFDKKVNAKKAAVDITKSLLMNENYQKYRIMK